MFSIQTDTHERRLIRDFYYNQFYADEAFIRTFNCQSMSYLRYKVQRAIFIFHDMLASMG